MRLLVGALLLEFIFAVVGIMLKSFQLFLVYVTLWADISHLVVTAFPGGVFGS